jgi:deoxyadenosine/deoxycytidine kinase
MNVGIFGSIGVGKTTLAEYLHNKFGIPIVSEPVEVNPYLDKFYSDPKKYGTITQMFFLISRYENMRYNKPGAQIYDRTIYEDHVFADVQHESGNIDDIDYNTYEKYYALMTGLLPAPDVIVYLYAPVSVLMERIKKRDRKCEAGISEEYLKQLEIHYETLYSKLIDTGINIQKVDWSIPNFDVICSMITNK